MNQSISRLWCTKMKAERMVHEGVKYKGAIQILKSFFMLKKDTPRLGLFLYIVGRYLVAIGWSLS